MPGLDPGTHPLQKVFSVKMDGRERRQVSRRLRKADYDASNDDCHSR
jgi:hypothetical protein